MSAEVLVIETRAANTASVRAAFERLGQRTRLSADPAEVAAAERVVLPGVGAFGPAMRRLRALGLDRALSERVRSGAPTLCICLGLQLLGAGSDEAPDVPGLGLIDARATAFPADVLVPQLGWNAVSVPEGPGCLRDGHAYFANSYRLAAAPAGWRVATADHGGPFVAALERGAVLACQFHPELSGAWGRELLARWLALAPAGLARQGASC